MARAALERVQWGSERSLAIAPPAHDEGVSGRTLLIVWRALAAHGWLIALILLIAFGESFGRWSLWLTAEPPQVLPTSGQMVERVAGNAASQMIVASASTEVRRFALEASVSDPIAPAPSVPLELSDAFREVHVLGDGETLGDLAQRYGISLAAILWANGLEGGDALMLGQHLRIPLVSGVPYVVSEGEVLDAIAARFGVSPEAIRSFGPNHIQDDGQLAAGAEIFVPGADPPLPEPLLAGGLAGLAARGAEPAGVVLADETNLRDGPGTDYGRQVQLGRGRQVALRARHDDWLKVEIVGATGWVRADLLQIAEGLIDALPKTDDFPPPPPRWTWPTWGTLTSSFGSRWGSFHNGIDIANRAWTPIVAARAGRVIEAGWCSGYGYCVKISHGGGVETIYGHLITKPSVAAGDEVAVGQRVGSMGSTYDRAGGGYSTGVHLHFTVLVNGRAVNPLTVLP